MAERVLDAILAAKAKEVAALRSVPCPSSGPRRSGRVRQALSREPGGPLRLITEIKRRSPSAGPLSRVLSVGERAVAYAEGGVAMISVLCDASFFDGAWEHLEEARSALDRQGLDVPLLAKEFVVDGRQIDEAARRGADAVLLIARIVDAGALAKLHQHATGLGLAPLVEVVNEAELGAALAAGAWLIGVNARDLDTLVMDAARAARVLAAVPADRTAVHLSGLKGPDDVAAIARAPNVSAALLGEALMRLDDPRSLLQDLVAAAGSVPRRP